MPAETDGWGLAGSTQGPGFWGTQRKNGNFSPISGVHKLLAKRNFLCILQKQ